MALMIAAGFLLRGLYVTYTVDPGFEYRDVAFVSLESAFDGYSPEESAAMRQRLMRDRGGAARRRSGRVHRSGAVGRRHRRRSCFASRVRARPIPGRAGDHRLTGLFLGARTADRARTHVHGGTRSGNRRPPAASRHRQRNDGPQPLAGRRSRSAGRCCGRTWHDVVDTLHVVGVAADAQVTALGQIDPYYVYVPGGGGALLVKSRSRFRGDGVGHPRGRESDRPDAPRQGAPTGGDARVVARHFRRR